MSAPTENFTTTTANFNRYKNSSHEIIVADCGATAATPHNIEFITAVTASAIPLPTLITATMKSNLSLNSKDDVATVDSSTSQCFSNDNGSSSFYGERSHPHHTHQQHKYRKRMHKRDKKRPMLPFFNPTLEEQSSGRSEHRFKPTFTTTPMHSTGTQTNFGNYCCEQCGGNKSLICLSCKPYAKAVHKTDAVHELKNLDTQSDTSLFSSELITTPRSKGDLLLQAIQRTPLVAAQRAVKTERKVNCETTSSKQDQLVLPVAASSTSLLAKLDRGYRSWKCRETMQQSQHHQKQQFAFNITEKIIHNRSPTVVENISAPSSTLAHLDSGYRAWKCHETMQHILAYNNNFDHIDVVQASATTAIPPPPSPTLIIPPTSEFSDGNFNFSTNVCTREFENSAKKEASSFDDFQNQQNFGKLLFENQQKIFADENDEVNNDFDIKLRRRECKTVKDKLDIKQQQSTILSHDLSQKLTHELKDLLYSPKPKTIEALMATKSTVTKTLAEVTEEEVFASSSKLTPHFMRLALSNDRLASTTKSQKQPPILPPKPLRNSRSTKCSLDPSSCTIATSIDCHQTLSSMQVHKTLASCCNSSSIINGAATMSDTVFPPGIVAINRLKFEQAAMAAANSTTSTKRLQQNKPNNQEVNSEESKIQKEINNTQPLSSPRFTTIFKRDTRAGNFQNAAFASYGSDEPQSSDGGGGICSDCGSTTLA